MSMVSLNRVVLAGNLTRDPELRLTTNGVAVCDFSVAVNRTRSRSEEADFFDVTAWRETGEAVANYKVKGDPILIEGRLQYSRWEVDDGTKHSKVKVVAEAVQFLAEGRRRGSSGSQGTGSQEAAASGRAETLGAAARGAPAAAVVDEADFDDLPF